MCCAIGCNTIQDNTNTGLDKPINNESFTNYVPWWATNNIATNGTIAVTNDIIVGSLK